MANRISDQYSKSPNTQLTPDTQLFDIEKSDIWYSDLLDINLKNVRHKIKIADRTRKNLHNQVPRDARDLCEDNKVITVVTPGIRIMAPCPIFKCFFVKVMA